MGQFHQFKNPRWLYYKIKTPGGLFATESNPRGWLCILAKKKKNELCKSLLHGISFLIGFLLNIIGLLMGFWCMHFITETREPTQSQLVMFGIKPRHRCKPIPKATLQGRSQLEIDFRATLYLKAKSNFYLSI